MSSSNMAAPPTLFRSVGLSPSPMLGLWAPSIYSYVHDLGTFMTDLVYGSFHGRFTVNIFFSTKYFFCLLTSKIIDTFFFQCDTWKFRDIIFLCLALGKIFFFLTAHCKSSFEYKMSPLHLKCAKEYKLSKKL